MNFPDELQLIFSTLPYRLPHLLVVVAGLLFAVSRLSRFPRISRLAIVAFGVMLLVDVFGIFSPLITHYVYQSTQNIQKMGLVSFVIGTITSLIHAAAFGLLVYAVWADRREV